MLSKIFVVAKHNLLTTALIFWNLGTNTFDFRMGSMSPTILDMAQVFRLKPLGRIVDAGECGDTSELFGDSEGKVKPKAKTWTFKISKTFTASIIAAPVTGMKKQTVSTKSIPLVVTPTSQFDHSTEKIMHFVEDDNNSLLLMYPKPLKCLLPILRFPLRVLEKPVSKRAKTTATDTFIPAPAPLVEATPTVTVGGAKEALSASSHHKAEWASNRVKCFQEKQVKSTAVLRQLVEEGSVMEEKIAVVDSEIQRLEEQLCSLKAEKVTLTNHFSQKVEEIEKISQEVEGSKTQLVNSNMYLGEPSGIFIIMQTYFSRIVL
ncbi:hypothetical protein D8674_009830 [Pyrus ussuriensis x Pyrus communis]|uniref:TMV resistance protein N-like n=1 Tax=Pyrus ussuriensis x Pyrus communis TaxID=2448454 RepID=A0A5N5F927_9ROSA|nr:hypothetical protein D8674_009830 [Pyrus ussuriensis x Pyrus communis]